MAAGVCGKKAHTHTDTKDTMDFTWSKNFSQLYQVAMSEIKKTKMMRGRKKKENQPEVRLPGVEPGSTAWKAAMLTVIPQTLALGGRCFNLEVYFSMVSKIQANQAIYTLNIEFNLIFHE